MDQALSGLWALTLHFPQHKKKITKETDGDNQIEAQGPLHH